MAVHKVATTFAQKEKTMSRFTYSFNFDDTFSLTLNSIEAKVQQVAKNFAPFSFVRGDWREIDMKADKADLPFIVFVVPE